MCVHASEVSQPAPSWVITSIVYYLKYEQGLYIRKLKKISTTLYFISLCLYTTRERAKGGIKFGNLKNIHKRKYGET